MGLSARKRRSAQTAWVLYDGSCRFCRATAARFRGVLQRKGFEVIPLQAPAAMARLQLPPEELLREMRVCTADGEVLGGAAALAALARRFWWGVPFYWFSRLPGCGKLLELGYRWFAARRHCLNGACSVGARHDDRIGASVAITVGPLLCLPAAAAILLRGTAPWLLMWAIAAALWVGLKWATLLDARGAGIRCRTGRVLGYMLAWPNTDALRFLGTGSSPRPMFREWLSGGTNTVLGIALLYSCAPAAYPLSPLLAGWVGMIGLVFILHFGIFKLLALAWRHAGVNATPLMDNPARSTGVAEFWGRRWNTGFSGPARRLLHAPLPKRIGPALATACVFLVSGLAHEAVISVPAGAGYGLPSAYFILQALGLQIERSPLGRRGGLGNGFRGWLFTVAVTAGPAVLLFHSTFVREVILPFLSAIGAMKETIL